jgi:hypothetical protein
MNRPLTLTKEELNEVIESAVLRLKHTEPSPKTIEMFDELKREFQEHKQDMAPVIEFFKTVNSLNKFLKWGGLSLFALLTAIYIFIRKL